MKKKVIKNCLRIIVVIAAFGFLAATQDVNALVDGVKKISIVPLAVGVLLFIFSNALVGLRWSRLLAALDIHFPILASIKVTFVGLFYNNMLLSNIGGDLLRGWYVTKYTDKRLEAAFSVVVDRVCGFFACLIMALGGLVASRKLFADAAASETAASGSPAEGMPLIMKLVIVVAVLAAASIVAIVILWRMKKLDSLLANLRSHIKRFWVAVVVYLKSPFVLLNAMGITIIAQSITVVGIYVACSSLNIDAPLKVFFIFFPLSWVIGALPVSPGGLGVLELGIVAMFATLPQVTNEQALMLALCQRIIFVAGSLPGFLIHLSGTHLPKE
ncbi:MAG: lysylphosphatidylglycerol synthase transmembrane domain-containing protein [Sedimentisphaeraceae bacterium JB056]